MSYGVKVRNDNPVVTKKLSEMKDGEIGVVSGEPYDGEIVIGVNYDGVVAFRLEDPGVPLDSSDAPGTIDVDLLPPGTVIELTVA